MCRFGLIMYETFLNIIFGLLALAAIISGFVLAKLGWKSKSEAGGLFSADGWLGFIIYFIFYLVS